MKQLSKDTYYFSHDFNARNDPKTSALIDDHGMEGYGFYWCLIEMIAEQNGHKLKKFPKLIQAIAKQCLSDASKTRSLLEAMLNDYNLLVEDEEFIWSESLIRRMEEKEKKKQAKVEAGRKGGFKSGETRNSKNDKKNNLKQNEAEAKQNEAPLEANEPKEKKRKESIITTTTTIKEIQAFWENSGFGTLSPNILNKMNSYLDDNMTEELILETLKIADENGARNWNYVNTILEQCFENKIFNASDFKAKEQERKNNKQVKGGMSNVRVNNNSISKGIELSNQTKPYIQPLRELEDPM